MELVTEIIGWCNGLKKWQQEALRLIFSNSQLSSSDTDTILQMIRSEDGLGIAPVDFKQFTAEDVPGAGGASTVRLVGLSGLNQVNGFPSGRSFSLPPDGMTILFGHNGAGKSGYARVLKNACNARHRVAVLPNAADPNPSTPSAEFAILVDDLPHAVSWIQDTPAHPYLRSILVHDVACANDYVDAEGVTSFQPYGLAQVTRLASMQRDMQTQINAERNGLSLNINQFSSLKGDTEVGRFIDTLGENSDRSILDRLTLLSDVEMQRISLIKQTLMESNPGPKAAELERLATRLDQAKQRAEGVQRWVSDKALARAKELIDAERVADEAMAIAQEQLRGLDPKVEDATQGTKDTAPLLEGTGGLIWQGLYRAAEAFSHHSAYSEQTFPYLDPDAHCVLCQQSYSATAAERMRNFAKFMASSTTSEADTANKARLAAFAKVKEVDLHIFDAPTLADVEERLPKLHVTIVQATSVWVVRHAWMMQVLKSGIWMDSSDGLLAIESDLDGALMIAAASLRADAKTILASGDPLARQSLVNELAELEARKLLSVHHQAVERFIKDSLTLKNLNQCYAALNPQSISRKLTTLAAKYVTEELATAMNAELKALGYRRRVRPALVGRTDLGMTKLTLRLTDITVKASKILSEGEQRAIGFAMFLAELELQAHSSAVVFDDPSTSLDHGYRRAIARRLVDMSAKRQVLVFTHDAVFLSELAMAISQTGCEASYKTVSWDDAPGLVQDGLTWTMKDTNARLTELREQSREFRTDQSDYPSDEIERKISTSYTSLRGTIERGIREVFLNNTVQPFSDVVSVDAFGAVVGHPHDEWELLQSIYARACEATEAHDTPAERQLPLPSRDELLADIDQVIDLIERAKARRKLYESQRSALTTKRKKALG